MARVLLRAQTYIEVAAAVLASVVTFGLMIVVVIDVVGRKAFNSPLQGAVEASELALPVIVFLGIAYVQAQRGHIKLELLGARLSPRSLWFLQLVSILIAFAISLIATVQVGVFAWDSWRTGDYTMGIVSIRIWPGRIAVFFGFFLLCVRLAIQIVEVFQDRAHIQQKISASGI